MSVALRMIHVSRPEVKRTCVESVCKRFGASRQHYPCCRIHCLGSRFHCSGCCGGSDSTESSICSTASVDGMISDAPGLAIRARFSRLLTIAEPRCSRIHRVRGILDLNVGKGPKCSVGTGVKIAGLVPCKGQFTNNCNATKKNLVRVGSGLGGPHGQLPLHRDLGPDPCPVSAVSPSIVQSIRNHPGMRKR